jgi:hypothetical protein
MPEPLDLSKLSELDAPTEAEVLSARAQLKGWPLVQVELQTTEGPMIVIGQLVAIEADFDVVRHSTGEVLDGQVLEVDLGGGS